MGLFNKKQQELEGSVAAATEAQQRLHAEVETLVAVLRFYKPGTRIQFGSPTRCPHCGDYGFVNSVNKVQGVSYNHCFGCQGEWMITLAAIQHIDQTMRAQTPTNAPILWDPLSPATAPGPQTHTSRAPDRSEPVPQDTRAVAGAEDPPRLTVASLVANREAAKHQSAKPLKKALPGEAPAHAAAHQSAPSTSHETAPRTAPTPPGTSLRAPRSGQAGPNAPAGPGAADTARSGSLFNRPVAPHDATTEKEEVILAQLDQFARQRPTDGASPAAARPVTDNPGAPAPAAALPAPAEPIHLDAPPPAPPTAAPSTLRILVVEDNPFDLAMFEEVVDASDQPVQVVSATTRSEAERIAATATFDIVLLELDLPDSAGIPTLLEWQHSAVSAAPVIVLIGHSDASVIREAKALGAFHVIQKTQLADLADAGDVGADRLIRLLRSTVKKHAAMPRHGT